MVLNVRSIASSFCKQREREQAQTDKQSDAEQRVSSLSTPIVIGRKCEVTRRWLMCMEFWIRHDLLIEMRNEILDRRATVVQLCQAHKHDSESEESQES
jgi:hypothetical protein